MTKLKIQALQDQLNEVVAEKAELKKKYHKLKDLRQEELYFEKKRIKNRCKTLTQRSEFIKKEMQEIMFGK